LRSTERGRDVDQCKAHLVASANQSVTPLITAALLAQVAPLSAEAQVPAPYPYWYPYPYYWNWAGYPWGWGGPWGWGWPVGVSVGFGGCWNCGFRGAFFRPGFSRFGFAHPGFFHPGFSRFGFAHPGFFHPGFGHFGFAHAGFGGGFHGGGRR